MVTPEGLTLPVVLASRGARAGALALDLLAMLLVAFAGVAAIGQTAGGMAAGKEGIRNGAMEFLYIVLVLAGFVLFNGWFLFWELGPRGATPAKRMLGIRIAARDGARLTAEMVIARNLLRQVELFLPIVLLAAVPAGGNGTAGWLAAGWFLIFALFPLWNRDRLRAGDLIAGTWVIETGHRRLAAALTAGGAAVAVPEYRFGDAELSVYGERELVTLERVLRDNREETLGEVAEAICAKIGWSAPGRGAARPFLEAYYAALRARLETGMRLGRRKADKHAA